MLSRNKDIMFLLGAGASAEAQIPAAGEMITRVEELPKSHDDWRPFEGLYQHIKSVIYYAAGLKGHFGEEVSYNIETLVNTRVFCRWPAAVPHPPGCYLRLTLP